MMAGSKSECGFCAHGDLFLKVKRLEQVSGPHDEVFTTAQGQGGRSSARDEKDGSDEQEGKGCSRDRERPRPGRIVSSPQQRRWP